MAVLFVGQAVPGHFGPTWGYFALGEAQYAGHKFMAKFWMSLGGKYVIALGEACNFATFA